MIVCDPKSDTKPTNNSNKIVLNKTNNSKPQSQNGTFQFTLTFEGISINIQEVKENQPENLTVNRTLDSSVTEENVHRVKKTKAAPDPEKLQKIRSNLNKILQTDCPVNGLQGVSCPVSNKKRKPSASTDLAVNRKCQENNVKKYRAHSGQEKIQKICANLNKILQSDPVFSESLLTPKYQITRTEQNNLTSDINSLEAVLSQQSENDFDEIDNYLSEDSHSIPTAKPDNSIECSSSNDSCSNLIDYAITADSSKAVTVSLNLDQTECEVPETPVPRLKIRPLKPKFVRQHVKKVRKVVKLKNKVTHVIKTERTNLTVQVKPEIEIGETKVSSFDFVDCNIGKIRVKPPSVLLPPKFPVVGVQKRQRPIKDLEKKPKTKVPKTERTATELVMCTEVVGNVQRLTVKTVEMLNDLCDSPKEEIAAPESDTISSRTRSKATKRKS